MIDRAAAGLAGLALGAVPDEGVHYETGIADSVGPLFVRFDRAPVGSAPQGPIAIATNSVIHATDPVLLIWIPGSHEYICLGKVTAA